MIKQSLKKLPPSTQRMLATLGENVRMARLRRALTTARVANAQESAAKHFTKSNGEARPWP